ncbi:hypothetical protein DL769_010796 [Monosporascus sp. CRB-8-3]|nr:hypothetical protein DL769_010796 [Monosporascus sp. CRB-8-3]
MEATKEDAASEEKALALLSSLGTMKVLPLDMIREILLELSTVGDLMRFAAVNRAARAVVPACINFDPSDNPINALMRGMRSQFGMRVYTRGLPDEYEVPSTHNPKFAPLWASAKRRVRCWGLGEALQAIHSRTCRLFDAETVWVCAVTGERRCPSCSLMQRRLMWSCLKLQYGRFLLPSRTDRWKPKIFDGTLFKLAHVDDSADGHRGNDSEHRRGDCSTSYDRREDGPYIWFVTESWLAS